MKINQTCPSVEDFLLWRSNLDQSLKNRKETIIELIDALSSNQQAHSVVELSLNPLFRRDYNSLYRGIQEFLPTKADLNYAKRIETLFSAVSRTIPRTSKHFNLFGVDTTPYPRPFAETLADKTFIHYPNPIKGNKPINIGHCYSVVCALPDRVETENVPWAVPLSGERVSSKNKGVNQGNQQLEKIWKSSLFSDKLAVLVADSDYSQRDFIGEQVKHEGVVTITRVRSDRVFYRQFIREPNQVKTSGHPRWYGEKFDLKDDSTWHEPDEVHHVSFTTKKGRQLTVTISGWKQMLMRATKNYKMNNYPFTLLQIVVKDQEGYTIWKPMWLIVIGERRDKLSLVDCYQSYRQRYDMEHLFRFGKQRLLMTSYLTPDVNHEENWFKLTLLSYVNLWAARKLAVVLPRDWEQYLKKDKSIKITPSLVQRDFSRIITTLGTSAKFPKRRGFSPGRIKGYKKAPRTRHDVIKKADATPRRRTAQGNAHQEGTKKSDEKLKAS